MQRREQLNMNGVMKGIVITIVGTVTSAAIIAGVSTLFYIPIMKLRIEHLETEQSKLSDEVAGLQQSNSRILGYIGSLPRNSEYNMPALINISNQKKISQPAFVEAVNMLDKTKNPEKAKSYLIDELGFTPAEAKNVLSKP